jgi:hypothetical protein
MHPGYNPNTLENDIALLIFGQDIAIPSDKAFDIVQLASSSS